MDESELDRYAQRAFELAGKATLLSNQLEQIVAAIQQLPGKIEVNVVAEDGKKLSLEKKSGEWVLLFVEETGFQEVGPTGSSRPKFRAFTITDAPIRIKALAAGMLPDLLQKLFAIQREMLNDVERGLDRLNVVQSLLDLGGPTE